MTEQKEIREEWPPEKRAFAAQWLIEKRLSKLREKMPPEVFVSFALSLDLILTPWETPG